MLLICEGRQGCRIWLRGDKYGRREERKRQSFGQEKSTLKGQADEKTNKQQKLLKGMVREVLRV